MFKPGVEIVAVLLFFAFSLTVSISTNFIVYRTCVVILGYNESDCALLGTDNISSATAELEKEVQPYANDISMVLSFVLSLLTIFFCFLIGFWIDKSGRKPALLTGLFSFTLYFVMILIICIIPNASPWWILLAFLPAVLTGGFPTFMTVMLCYVSDASSESDRGFRMGIIECCMSIGSIIGTLISSYIFNAGGYIMAYGICVVCCSIAFLYVLFFLPEIVHYQDNELDVNTFSFDMGPLKNTFLVFFKRRENQNRTLLMLLTSILVVCYLTSTSASSLMFLYTREKFQWSLRTYTYYSCFGSLITILGTSLGIYIFHKVFRMSEQLLILLGFIGMILSSVIFGVANQNWMMYLGSVVSSSGVGVSPMCRSLISKLADEGDVGKIFSVISAMESLTGMVGTPFYMLVYNSTLNFYSGFFNFMTTIFATVGLVSTAWVMYIKQRQVIYSEMVQNQ